jgi:energy-coupling factor transporter ATP-binding protein EcfA2
VAYSDWIGVEDVTALIGVNESGKSNLLVPLWKLKPAREGEIRPTSDYPKTMFAEIRENPGGYCFISAEFSTGAFAEPLAAMTGLSVEAASIVRVDRFYDGGYIVSFPLHEQQTTAGADEVTEMIRGGIGFIEKINPLAREEALKPEIVSALKGFVLDLPAEPLTPKGLEALAARIRGLAPENPAKTSGLLPQIENLAAALDDLGTRLSEPEPGDDDAVHEAVIKRLPRFVYYSNYGDLDSEIYLPHVVENLKRTDLGEKEAAKARTLRVLFSFVRLKPSEILELGRDFVPVGNPQRRPSAEEIAQIAENKRERSILLQSAHTSLTQRFKEWWKQGDYRFRFEADGDHFRIWVADDRRPAEVELEGRSTGLQWFLSFYLVFLVESQSSGEHGNAILLLDEPGLSLHPLAQHDLSRFFDSLSATNQLIYTTHSPFLVHADRLDRARKVYVDDDGTTKATSDLRRGAEKQAGAAYAVHSALGLSVAESLMLGCQPVIVEGSSDQHYLTAIKTLLISDGSIAPNREIIFPPAGGTKNTRMVASILTGRDEELPYVVLDGDQAGKRQSKELASSLYQEAANRLLDTDDFVGMAGSEVEDLIPANIVASVLNRYQRNADTEFADVVKPGTPIVGQIEEWARGQGLPLPQGWKVELAKRIKQHLLNKGLASIPEEHVARWRKLFAAFGDGSDA